MAATKLEQAVADLTTEVRLSNQQWEAQGELNVLLLEKIDGHGRSLYGHNSEEGLVGGAKTQAEKIKNLEEAETEHGESLKFWRRLVITSVATLVVAVFSSGVLLYLGWH
jgi:hypothetical protein